MKVNNIFKRNKDNYLLLEERNGGFDVTQAALDAERKKITTFERRTVKNLNAVRRRWRRPAKVIFALGGRKAATIESVLDVRRDDPSARIAEEELDQLVFKGLWEFLNRYRSWAGKKLKAPDVDLILSDIQVRDVALDRRRLFNPVGFDGREISFRLRGTFTVRSVLPLTARFRSWGEVIVLESGSVLGGSAPDEDYWFVLPGEEGTRIYRRRMEESAFAGEIPWSTRSLSEGLKKELSLDDAALAEFVRRYEAGEISERFKRLTESFLNEGLRSLGEAVHSFTFGKRSGGRPKVYFHIPSPFTPRPDWLKRLGGEFLRLDERLERENFTLETKKDAAGFSPVRDQTTLALLLYSYDAPKYSFLNGVLHRRARWLIPSF